MIDFEFDNYGEVAMMEAKKQEEDNPYQFKGNKKNGKIIYKIKKK